MSITPLSLVKSQLNLDHDHDDPLLSHYIGTAEEWIAAYIGKPLPAPVPASITHAVLLLVANWYVERGAASDQRAMAVPFGVHELLAVHRQAVTGYVPEEADHGA